MKRIGTPDKEEEKAPSEIKGDDDGSESIEDENKQDVSNWD